MQNKLSPVDPSALTLTFDDEFSSFNSSPDGSVGWMTQYPFSGAQRTLPYTHEAEYLSDPSTGVNPFSLSNGVLDITATVAPPGSNPLNLPYNSGAITTYKSFAQLYGYFEVRAELPTGQGLWPAFWMMPVNGQPGTELDIFEVLGNSPTTMNSSTHSSNASLGLTQALQVANTSTGFHSYGVDWEPTTITFYFDGQAIATAPTPPDMNVPMYMLLSLAVGGAGSWPGPTNASSKFPATMQIDYVRAYATAATVGTSDPHPQAGVAVLPAIQAAAPTGTGSISAAVARYAPAGPQAGVGVALLNAAGQVVATATTDSTGNVKFGNLGAGTYQLRYLPPPSLLLQPGSQADVTTGLTASFKLGAGQGLTVIHETVTSAAHVGGAVQLAGVPQAGVAVQLLDTKQSVVATTTTDGTGAFNFYAPAGTYTVRYLPPAGEAVLIGSHASTATGISAPVTLVAGQSFLISPEALVANPGTVSGSVVYTNATTAAQAGVSVSLLSGSTTVATATTDALGRYSFSNVAAGTYQVSYTPLLNTILSTSSPADPVTGLVSPFALAPGQTVTLSTETLLPAPSALSGTVLFTNGVAVGESGIAVTLLSGSGSTLASTTTDGKGAFGFANLAAGTYQVRYAAPSGEVLQSGPGSVTTGLTGTLNLAIGQTLTMGTETIAGTLGTITGTTMFGGAAQAGVTVRLINGTGATAGTTVTNGSGAYHFTALPTGYYRVQYSAPAGEVIQGGPADLTTGLTTSFGVTAGTTRTLGPVTLATDPHATIRGTVAVSSSGLGSVNAAGATVVLLNTSNAVVATATTDATGSFQFGGVNAGTYQVKYAPLPNTVLGAATAADPATGLTAPITVAPSQTLALPTEILAPAPASLSGKVQYVDGTASAQAGVAVTLLSGNGTVVATTTTDATGSFRFAGINSGTYQVKYAPLPNTILGASSAADPTTGLAAPVTVSPGQALALPTEILAPAPASLSGVVQYADGIISAQAGVAVSLLSANGTVVGTTTTDANGAFQFSGLAHGAYQVQYEPVANTILGASSAADPTTGLAAPVTVSPGQALALPTEILAPAPASLSGVVQYADGTVVAQAGVAVTLLSGNGSTVATTTTDANGAFRFTGLAHGAYQVQYAPVANTILGASSAADPATGLAAPVTVSPGQALALPTEILAPAPASLSGVVQYADGTVVAQAGVAVTLLSGNGTVVGTTTTDANGAFQFSGLAHGAYQVQYAPLPNTILGASSAADPATGLAAPVTVSPGQALALPTEILAPAPASLSGVVQYAGATTAAQAGVAVTLLSGNGSTVATTTTDANGAFQFNGLAHGAYQVQYAPLPNTILGASSAADPATGLAAPVTVSPGQALALPTETLAPAFASLSGSVLYAGAGQPGVSVALRDVQGHVVATTTSDTMGGFTFTGLTPGSYALAYTAPSGEMFQVGDPADTTSGCTAQVSLVAGQNAVAAPEHLLLMPVSLALSGSGAKFIHGDGPFIVTGNPGTSSLVLGNGDQSVTLGGFYNSVTLGQGNDTITLNGPGQKLHVGDGIDIVTLNGSFDVVTLGNTPRGATSTVVANGSSEQVTGGNGNFSVTGATGGTAVTLGNGNDTVTMTGSHNTVTVGIGTNVISAGINGETVRAGGGNVSVKVGGQNNLVDIGPGSGTIDAGTGSRLDTFVLNGANQGLVAITGFTVNTGDVLDLTRTLAGTSVARDLSNVGNFITAINSNGNTTLRVDPTGGSGTPYSFVTLAGVSTTVGALAAAHDFRMG